MSSKITKLKGKAVSQWVHIRNWPLVIRNLVSDLEDPVVNLGLKLHEIVERVTAQEFFPYEVDILEEKLVGYLELRKTVRSDFPSMMPKWKPKHHFLRTDTFIRKEIFTAHGLLTKSFLFINFNQTKINQLNIEPLSSKQHMTS